MRTPPVITYDMAILASKPIEFKPPKKHCFSCNVKLSVVQQGIKCKCDNSFCGNCRYPEKHNCTYDHKLEGKERLRDELVEVKGDKLEMRI
jgi:hypothetical protein